MFELSIAFKYLIPRWRQLSVSIISIISTLVIALVVWLIVVFFSVKDGLENSWVDKIIALTAPVRITPTEKYYQSYYYLADTVSAASNYSSKSIGEKLAATTADPYNPETDEEIPRSWPKPDRDGDGNLKDLVKIAVNRAESLSYQGITATDYETTVANLRLRLLRHGGAQPTQQFLEHAAFLGSFDADTTGMAKALLAPSVADFNNLLRAQAVSADNIQEETPSTIHRLDPIQLRERWNTLFDTLEITALKVAGTGWRLQIPLLQSKATFAAVAVFKGDKLARIVITGDIKDVPALTERLNAQGWKALPATVTLNDPSMRTIQIEGSKVTELAGYIPLEIASDTLLYAHLIPESLTDAATTSDLKFALKTTIQGIPLAGKISLGNLEVGEAHLKSIHDPISIAIPTSDASGINMPPAIDSAEPILLPRTFKESGAYIGDQGYLSYYSPTPSSVQEQRIPVYIAGFYDPGIIPIGGKLVLASRELTSLVRTSSNQDEAHMSNGINVRFKDIADAGKVKAALQKELEDAGIASYWHVSTYQEYEFTKDIIQQLQSEKNLFSLISFVIIIVACSNIISMLIILVNDKKLEIGILRSMGASSGSIAAIFGICGMVMGAFGSIVGIAAALVTVHYVNELVGLISQFQGHDLFNPVFYGHTLPSELSMEALTFVIITTAFISLLAGIVPAFKASMMKPSAILRSE